MTCLGVAAICCRWSGTSAATLNAVSTGSCCSLPLPAQLCIPFLPRGDIAAVVSEAGMDAGVPRGSPAAQGSSVSERPTFQTTACPPRLPFFRQGEAASSPQAGEASIGVPEYPVEPTPAYSAPPVRGGGLHPIIWVIVGVVAAKSFGFVSLFLLSLVRSSTIIFFPN